MTDQKGFIPLVPYESEDEYRKLLSELTIEYQQMVETSLNLADWRDWLCVHYRGLGARYHWHEHGEKIFLKFTKGKGIKWCEMVNGMLIYSLDTAVRVCIRTHEWLGEPMSGDENDKIILSEVLEKEISINTDMCDGFTILEEFHDKNFKYLYSESHNNDGYHIPIQKYQDLQLTFVMGLHSRLGQNSPAQGLSNEIVQLIFNEMAD